jgi:hypothetical protein
MMFFKLHINITYVPNLHALYFLFVGQYDFEISNAKRADDRDEVYSRVSNLPALINLGS